MDGCSGYRLSSFSDDSCLLHFQQKLCVSLIIQHTIKHLSDIVRFKLVDNIVLIDHVIAKGRHTPVMERLESGLPMPFMVSFERFLLL